MKLKNILFAGLTAVSLTGCEMPQTTEIISTSYGKFNMYEYSNRYEAIPMGFNTIKSIRDEEKDGIPEYIFNGSNKLKAIDDFHKEVYEEIYSNRKN